MDLLFPSLDIMGRLSHGLYLYLMQNRQKFNLELRNFCSRFKDILQSIATGIDFALSGTYEYRMDDEIMYDELKGKGVKVNCEEAEALAKTLDENTIFFNPSDSQIDSWTTNFYKSKVSPLIFSFNIHQSSLTKNKNGYCFLSSQSTRPALLKKRVKKLRVKRSKLY